VAEGGEREAATQQEISAVTAATATTEETVGEMVSVVAAEKVWMEVVYRTD
jgi:hypothetical protein